jgi:hypothetical protein
MEVNLELFITLGTIIVTVISSFVYIKFNDKRQDDLLAKTSEKLDLVTKLFDSLNTRVNRMNFEHNNNIETIKQHTVSIEKCKDIYHSLARKDDFVSIEKFEMAINHLEKRIEQMETNTQISIKNLLEDIMNKMNNRKCVAANS